MIIRQFWVKETLVSQMMVPACYRQAILKHYYVNGNKEPKSLRIELTRDVFRPEIYKDKIVKRHVERSSEVTA